MTTNPCTPTQAAGLNAARFHFFLLGVAILLPWNSYITAVDYFNELFPGQHVDRVFSVAYMSVNIVSIVLSLRLQRHLTAPVRVTLGLLGYVVALLAVPLADFSVASGVLALQGYQAVLVAGVIGASFSDGIIQPAVFGEAAELPLSCVQVR
jgi:solute carrier family 29 (equilibrative nucleoside transporter), member 1/2/3